MLGFKILRCSTSSLLEAASVFWGHEGRLDRAEGTLYVQSTCMDVQGLLCTVTLKGRPCTRPLCQIPNETHGPKIDPMESKVVQVNI